MAFLKCRSHRPVEALLVACQSIMAAVKDKNAALEATRRTFQGLLQ
jgi:hypothetical protein